MTSMGDRMGTELVFWLNGKRHAMWFDEAIPVSRIDWLRQGLDNGGFSSLKSLCEAHYVDGVLVKGDPPPPKHSEK